MRRRDFIAGIVGSAVAWPLAARAQPRYHRPRVGMLMHASENDSVTVNGLAAFKRALGELGWAEARNLQIDHRYSDGNAERLPVFAKELIALQPDVLFSRGTPPTMALFKETRVIPIVFVAASDPVGSGFALSLARPGGNVTGFSNFEQTMASKWLELLKEVAPGIARVAVIFNPASAVDAGKYFLRPIEDAARSVRVATIAKPIHDVDELESTMAAFAREQRRPHCDPRPVQFHPSRSDHRPRDLVSVARSVSISPVYKKRRVTCLWRVDSTDLFRRSASYVDRILHGGKPADLPIQQPTKFELIVNLGSAKAIGLSIPELFLLRADEVIE